MVIDLHDGGYAEQLATSSDTTTHDIDELVSQIDLIASKLDRYSLAGRFSVVFSLTVLALVVSLLLLMGRDLIISIISTFGVTVSMVGGALSLFAEREKRRADPTLKAFLQLLRQTAPALVQQGRISELRWATIKIQLSQYGI